MSTQFKENYSQSQLLISMRVSQKHNIFCLNTSSLNVPWKYSRIIINWAITK